MSVECRWCGSSFDIRVSDEQVKRWRDGELIQWAMPELTADERELLISGTCGKCWERMFG